MTKIIWLSRHQPTPSQRAELERLFPSHTLEVDHRSFDGAKDIVARFRASGADEMVVVAPLNFTRELIKRGLYPLWAEMKQVSRGSPHAEVKYNGRAYKFVRFHRMTGIDVKLEPVNPPSPAQTNPASAGSNDPVGSTAGAEGATTKGCKSLHCVAEHESTPNPTPTPVTGEGIKEQK